MDEEDIITIKCDDGNFAKVHLFGATVISWHSENNEQLFLSRTSKMDGSKAIRGGIPIVFPNFGPWDCGPQHGFARISWWKPVSPADSSEYATASFRLEDDENTRKMWNFGFQLIYTVSLKPKELTTSLKICNRDSKEFDFTTLLHTYFKVPDINQCTVDGFKGCKFTSKVSGEKDVLEERDEIKITENVDSVYAGAGSSGHQIKCSDRMIKFTKTNLDDTVLWNPWSVKAKEMSDFDDDGYLHMVCVEAGHVANRKILAAGSEITVSQTISVEP